MILSSILLKPSYHEIVNFVRRADTVVTFVTNGYPISSNFKFPTTEGKITERNKADHDSKFRLFPKYQREQLASFLAGVSVPSEGTYPSCFTPHHYVYAVKGTKHVRFDICFTCSVMEVNGNFYFLSRVNQTYLAKTERLFGMKFDPKDPLPAPAKDQSSNTVENSRGKG